MGSYCLMGPEFLFGIMESFVNGGSGAQHCE